MIPKKIHYCWLSGEPLPDLFKECLDSWARVMPDYDIVLWDKDRFDISAKPFVKEACDVKKWAFASDYIRLYAICSEGGIYLDADVFVRKRFDDFLQYDCFTSVEYHQHIAQKLQAAAYLNPDGTSKYKETNIPGIGLQAAVIGGIKGHAFLKDCLDFYDSKHFLLEDGTYYDKILSPGIYAIVAEKHGFVYKDLKQELNNNMVVFPSETFAVEPVKATDNSYAIHMIAGSWRAIKKEPLYKRMRIAFQNTNLTRRVFNRKLLKVKVQFKLKRKGNIVVAFYTLEDHCLKTMDMGNHTPGTYQLDNNQLKDLPSGKYTCRIYQDQLPIKEFFLVK